MSEQATRELFLRQKDYWAARDADALAACHAPDGVVVSPIFRTVTGADKIRESYRQLFQIFPDWDYQAQELLVCGDRAAETFVVKATHVGEFLGLPGSRKRVEFHGVRVFELRDGLIARERRYYDFTGLLIQLGILKSKPA